MTGTEHFAHLAKIADILGELSEEIETLGVRLCCNPAVAREHMADLQAIDLIGQKQRWLADLLRAECPVSAVEAINVEMLQRRMRAVR